METEIKTREKKSTSETAYVTFRYVKGNEMAIKTIEYMLSMGIFGLEEPMVHQSAIEGIKEVIDIRKGKKKGLTIEELFNEL